MIFLSPCKWMAKQSFCPSPPPYLLSLIFQTLLIFPGHLSEKIMTFKKMYTWEWYSLMFPGFQCALHLPGLCVCVFLIVVLVSLKARGNLIYSELPRIAHTTTTYGWLCNPNKSVSGPTFPRGLFFSERPYPGTSLPLHSRVNTHCVC